MHSDLAVRNISVRVLSLYPPFDVQKPEGGLFEARKRLMHIYLDPLGLGHFGLKLGHKETPRNDEKTRTRASSDETPNLNGSSDTYKAARSYRSSSASY